MNKRISLLILIGLLMVSTIQFVNVQAADNNQQTISINNGHTLALTDDSDGDPRILAWGWNEFTQLGNDKNSYELRPIEITNFQEDDENIVSLAAGKQHSLALTKSGRVLAWGANNTGQVGNNEHELSYSQPQEVKEYQESSSDSQYTEQTLKNVIAIQAGDQHSVALKADGTVWSWGSNEFDQLGQHKYIPTGTKRVAEQVLGLENIVEINSYRSHNLALDEDGTVWTWGENWGGQMSSGLESTKNPFEVEGLPPIKSIATGSFHSLALDKYGNVWSWGVNDFNQRNQDDRDYAKPYLVPGLSNIVTIAAGDAHNLAIDSSGQVWAWGNNSFGEVGISQETEIVSNPEPLYELDNVAEVAAGDQYSIAKTEDGTIYTWGRNQNGQLGNGTNTNRHEPTSVNIAFVTGVKLNQHTVELKPDESTQLKATVFPFDAISKDVVWSSSNEDVVTVNENGEITAVADSSTENEATITVTTKSGGYTDHAEVSIKVPVTGIDITKNVLTLERVLTDDGLEDDSFKLNAQVYPFNATDKRVIWESEDEDIVSVDPRGVVTAESKGKTTVKATSIDGGWTDEITIYVTIPVDEIHIRGDDDGLDMIEGQEYQLDYYIYPMNATNQHVYKWSSSNENVATVNQLGKITAKNDGTTTITVTTQDKRKQGEIRVHVEAGEYKKLSGFQIPKTMSLKALDRKQIETEFFPSDASNKKVYWRSKDEDIATVDANGNVKALASGKVTIIGRTADRSYKQEIEVKIGPNTNGWLLEKERKNVSRTKTWDIRFNTVLDAESVNEDTVYIKDIYSKEVELDISLSNDGKTVSIKPTEKLRGDTIFYLYITDEIKSKSGTPLKNGTKMVFETY
ncbi:Ig-like domain-containing protein [Pontibacillus sp. HMF3514]|uniref:RCC1 domain-containing protein n=1 Tax=Pontibacillus sp. HMF3514 TaxID=2692425 RepID=UPI00131FDF83|nr:Ig-like domain-containing protein [Pontibacillus sp. HMF3514]QHE53616.1 hypothetical protein GS400_17050 [Pontibacillus sp. HMF3514]